MKKLSMFLLGVIMVLAFSSSALAQNVQHTSDNASTEAAQTQQLSLPLKVLKVGQYEYIGAAVVLDNVEGAISYNGSTGYIQGLKPGKALMSIRESNNWVTYEIYVRSY